MRLTATLDRLEGQVAVLLLEGGHTIEMPADALPPEAAEGHVLHLHLSVDRVELDAAATEALEASVAERQARLSEEDEGGDISL